jgi:hypothetical protein
VNTKQSWKNKQNRAIATAKQNTTTSCSTPSFSICFSNNDGQVFGGTVGGPIIAADVIYVNAALINDFDVVDVDTIQIDSESDSN